MGPSFVSSPLDCELKPSQNKKGRKNFQLHRFLNTFSQLLAVKMYSKNGAAVKYFGPSYFDPALVITRLSISIETKIEDISQSII